MSIMRSHAVPQPDEVAFVGQHAELDDGVVVRIVGTKSDLARGEDTHHRAEQPATGEASSVGPIASNHTICMSFGPASASPDV